MQEQKIHIVLTVRNCALREHQYISMSRVFPDPASYYLLSIYLETDDGAKLHSLWANDAVDPAPLERFPRYPVRHRPPSIGSLRSFEKCS